MKLFSILFLACIFNVFACSTDKDDEMCFAFDERQCGVDPFTSSGTIKEKETAIKDFLVTQGVEDPEVDIEENYYDAVCEACTVCPETYRIYVEIDEAYKGILEGLDLLNFSEENCD